MVEPTQYSASGPERRRIQRGLVPVLVAGLIAGGVGGGAAGSAATLFWANKIAPAPAPAAAAAAAPSASTTQSVSLTNGATVVSDVFQKVSPSVVSITSESTVASPLFGQNVPVQGEGSGFVVDRQGHILTNNHVVAGAKNLTVKLVDGTTAQAQVVGTDPASDLAVIKADLPAAKLQPVPLGDSDAVVPGQVAIAIGTPFGLDQTVTSGIVSAVNRDWGSAGGRPLRGLIQTDAPINPGNSGGPLLNVNGQVIGITTAIESPVRGSVGVGFAIPINAAKRLLPKLVAGQKIEHPWLGIAGLPIDPTLAKQLGLTIDHGVYVAQVQPNSPAAAAGLHGARQRASANPRRQTPQNPLIPSNPLVPSLPSDTTPPRGGDVITAIDGRAVQTVNDIAGYIDGKAVGDGVTLTVQRGDQQLNLQVKLGAWPTQGTQS